MKNHRSFVVMLFLILLLLSACNYPVDVESVLPTAEVVYTQAAETISAQLTQLAAPATLTPESLPPMASATVEFLTPTPTPESATGTPTATSTPEPSPTIQPVLPTLSSDPRATLGDATFLDTFRTSNNWSLYEDEHVRFRISDNQLMLMAFDANGRDGWMLSWPEPDNFYLEMTAQPEDCQGLDRYGLIFRSNATDGYLLGLSCDGRYSLRTWDGEQFDELIDWTPIPAISSGSNQGLRLGVRADGDVFTIYINGQAIDEVEDDLLEDGGFGVFVGADDTEDFRVWVTEIALWELP
jgi:hypothetical protein